MRSRIYHSLHLDHTDNGSEKVVYILLPDQMKEGDLASIEAIADENKINIILVSGFDWESAMTPWKTPVPESFTKKMYEGKAKGFLDEFVSDYCFLIENSMRIEKPERYLIGISLSGLFAVWATAQKDCFKGVASISGSFWYEDFVEWISKQEDMGCETNKTLAKMDSKFAKQYRGYRSVCMIATEEKRRKALELFDLADVWGVGRQTLARLNYYGITTLQQFADKPEWWVQSHFTKPGIQTWMELNGIPCIDTEEIVRS